MIAQETISQIIDTARVEEVIGDYVNLRRRGVNMIGLCPFHHEKTPSFTVSPTKGIYKCFGCGASGNAVKFLMEHEHFSYPEALKHLAAKYSIEVIETERTDEEKAAIELKESLFIITGFARQYFIDLLWKSEEGKSIGLAYFKERGFREETIKKFELGYCLDQYDHFTKAALDKGYQLDLLKQTGLVKTKEGRNFDFFRDRVQFPIHNLSGKIIAFAGRTLRQDKKIPKYINSPETEIYNKSKVLYGAWFAKNAIRAKDNCFLVEGYTDVISLHQEGIENVVASSGTSLTVDQIRLIKRFTDNITILYDGDPAGINAALRGVDLVLEQGLNVRIVLLPEGDDPDSFIKSAGVSAFNEYVSTNARDFVLFKASLLLDEAQNDPIKKADLVKDIVGTVARIQDPIKRSVYIKECSQLLDIPEPVLITASNRINRQNFKKKLSTSKPEDEALEKTFEHLEAAEPQKEEKLETGQYQERDIIRILLEFGHKTIEGKSCIAQFIINELENIPFDNELYLNVIQVYKDHLREGVVLDSQHFVQHSDEAISALSISLLTSPYVLSSNWDKMYDISVPDREGNFLKDVKSGVTRFKYMKVKKMFVENQQKLKEAQLKENHQEISTFQQVSLHLQKMKMEIAKALGTVYS